MKKSKRYNRCVFFFILFMLFPLSCSKQQEHDCKETTKGREQSSLPVNPFVKAYPAQVMSVKDNVITFCDGTTMSYDDGISKDFDQCLKRPDIQDMLFQRYTPQDGTPAFNHDPGRFRNQPFFKKMYGSTREEVEDKLTEIVWMPGISDTRIQVTTVNGVDEKLRAVSEELAALPHEFYKYVDHPAGGYFWRNIAGTARMSAHSFGIAFDITVKYSNYWRWDREDDPEYRYTNQVPAEVVACFERHGFIWGGRWYHYDTMHFEYRPELLQ